jgi:hypothetical protein
MLLDEIYVKAVTAAGNVAQERIEMVRQSMCSVGHNGPDDPIMGRSYHRKGGGQESTVDGQVRFLGNEYACTRKPLQKAIKRA